MDIKNFISYFDGTKEVSTNKYMALCPAHDDRNPSLSIGLSEDNSHILLHCHAGCEAKDVLSSVGLKFKDLYPENSTGKAAEVAQTRYTYLKADGSVAYDKIRIDYADGSKGFYFKQPDGKKNLKGVEKELYNLPAVINAAKVYFVEGEKCADAVNQQGAVATTLCSGAKSHWDSRYSNYLQNKEVVIIPDNDEPGRSYATKVLQNLPNAKVVELPELPEKGDIYDWLNMGHTMSELDELPHLGVYEYLPRKADAPSTTKKAAISQDETQAQTIIRLVEENGAVLFHDTANEPFVALTIDGHKEVWSIGGDDFKSWLELLYYMESNKPAKKESVAQAISVLNAKARFDSKNAVSLGTRVVKSEHAFWYSLSNADWQAVKITADGWEIVNDPPIMFKRYRHQHSQCQPQKGGDVRRILKYVNLKSMDTLFLCWLVCCFVSDIPHAMPIFFGEKGAAKTTTCTLLKKLIDPSTFETLTIPKDSGSLAVNLQQHWFLPFDNVFRIDEATSDTLCRAITGGGIQQRRLHTNGDDYIFTFQKCLALNGINNVANRADLLDRAILIELTRIDESERRELSELKAEFESDLPYILGGVFDILSEAMRIYPTVKLERLPRMADFARWGYAIGEALGGLGNEFIREYRLNQERRDIEVINSDIVATLMVAFMKDKSDWNGQVSELLNQLLAIAPQCGISSKASGLPQQASALSRRLNELKSNLREAGITFDTKVKTQGTFITITNEKIAPLPPYGDYLLNSSQKEDSAVTECTVDDEDEVVF